MAKNFLRSQMKYLRDNIPDLERNRQNKEIKNSLLNLPVYKNSKSIHSFVSFNGEVDTREIISHGLENDKSIFVPKTNKKHMDFYRISSLSQLKIGTFKVPEPEDSFEKDLACHDGTSKRLMLVPGLAFDRKGNRIGYGAGYYDRYLSEFGSGFLTIALAFENQIMEYIKPEDHDIKVDMIITPKEIIRCKSENTRR